MKSMHIYTLFFLALLCTSAIESMQRKKADVPSASKTALTAPGNSSSPYEHLSLEELNIHKFRVRHKSFKWVATDEHIQNRTTCMCVPTLITAPLICIPDKQLLDTNCPWIMRCMLIGIALANTTCVYCTLSDINANRKELNAIEKYMSNKTTPTNEELG